MFMMKANNRRPEYREIMSTASFVRLPGMAFPARQLLTRSAVNVFGVVVYDWSLVTIPVWCNKVRRDSYVG
jgi:hypothetical protein